MNHKDLNELKNLYFKYDLEVLWEIACQHVKNSILIELDRIDDDDIPVGVSKMGGMPDLPNNFEWPLFNSKHLNFLAQINLSELVEFDTNKELPHEGYLHFFYGDDQPWGNSEEFGNWRVIYHPSNAILHRIDISEYSDLIEAFPAATMSYSNCYEVPGYFNLPFYKHNIDDKIYNNYINMVRNFEESKNKILGFPYQIQPTPVDMCCQIEYEKFRNPKVDFDQKVEQLINDSAEWQLLLQLESYGECGFEWADNGTLYFFAKSEEIQIKNFSEAWVSLISH